MERTLTLIYERLSLRHSSHLSSISSPPSLNLTPPPSLLCLTPPSSPPLLLSSCLSREEVTCCRPALCHLADFLSSLPQERVALQGIPREDSPLLLLLLLLLLRQAPAHLSRKGEKNTQGEKHREKRKTKNTVGKERQDGEYSRRKEN